MRRNCFQMFFNVMWIVVAFTVTTHSQKAQAQESLPEAHCWDNGEYQRKDLFSGEELDPAYTACPNAVFPGENFVSPLFRSQSSCGWCARFANIHTMEIQASIAFPGDAPITLSLQHLVDYWGLPCRGCSSSCLGVTPMLPRCDPDYWNQHEKPCDLYSVYGLVRESVETLPIWGAVFPVIGPSQEHDIGGGVVQ